MIFRLLPLLFLFACAQQQIVEKPQPPAPIKKAKKTAGCFKQVQFYKLLSKLGKSTHSFKVFNKLSTRELCTEYPDKTKKLLLKHQNKIGIIYHPQDQFKDNAILKGLLQASSKKLYSVTKVNKSKESVNKALANMVFKEKVGVLVTWGPKGMLKHIQKWENGLKIPTIYIDKEVKKKDNSFKVYPSRSNYAFEMLKELRKRNVKRIAILTPERYRKADFLNDIKKMFKAAKIQIVFDEVYNSENYDSMDMACRRIFVIDRFKRRSEYNAIYNVEKRKAKKEGFKLNPKLVFLPARVDYDAIFIPDNFKIVNHFVKLFQYYKVRKIPLFGTHEWRSPELVETNKSFLNGSFFVDFVDSPKKFQEQTLSQTLDYKMMGFYSGVIGKKALKQTKHNRAQVAKKLKTMKLNKKAKVFRRNEFNWPTYAFEIQNKSIVPSR